MGKKISEAIKESWKIECKCVRCDAVFLARKNTRLYCDECKVHINRENQTKYQKEHKHEIAERRKRERQANPEKYKSQFAKWYAVNKKANAEKAQRWREANPEKYLQQARDAYWRNWESKKEQREQNKEQRKESARRSRRANLEKDAAKSRRRYARKRGATGSHTLEAFLIVCDVWEWRCVYCGTPLNKKSVTEDHVIPISKGGTDFIDNIVPACASCNSRKNNLYLEEFVARYGSFTDAAVIERRREYCKQEN